MALKLPVSFWPPRWFHTYTQAVEVSVYFNKISFLVSHKLQLTFLRSPGHMYLSLLSWFFSLIFPWIRITHSLTYGIIFLSVCLSMHLLGCGVVCAIALVWRSEGSFKGSVFSSTWVTGIKLVLSRSTFNCGIGISKSVHRGKTPVFSSINFSQSPSQ